MSASPCETTCCARDVSQAHLLGVVRWLQLKSVPGQLDNDIGKGRLVFAIGEVVQAAIVPICIWMRLEKPQRKADCRPAALPCARQPSIVLLVCKACRLCGGLRNSSALGIRPAAHASVILLPFLCRFLNAKGIKTDRQWSLASSRAGVAYSLRFLELDHNSGIEPYLFPSSCWHLPRR